MNKLILIFLMLILNINNMYAIGFGALAGGIGTTTPEITTSEFKNLKYLKVTGGNLGYMSGINRFGFYGQLALSVDSNTFYDYSLSADKLDYYEIIFNLGTTISVTDHLYLLCGIGQEMRYIDIEESDKTLKDETNFNTNIGVIFVYKSFGLLLDIDTANKATYLGLVKRF